MDDHVLVKVRHSRGKLLGPRDDHHGWYLAILGLSFKQVVQLAGTVLHDDAVAIGTLGAHPLEGDNIWVTQFAQMANVSFALLFHFLHCHPFVIEFP